MIDIYLTVNFWSKLLGLKQSPLMAEGLTILTIC